MSKRLHDRIALVTGATRGIGWAAAVALASEGAHVIALARTEGALAELDDAISEVGGKATLVPVNLSDFDALDRLGASIHERWGQLDVLIGNAGVLGPLSPVGHIGPKDWQKVIDVNLTANFRLIRTMDPLLRASDAGRALFVTSGAAHMNMAYWSAYATSKAALEALVRAYANEIDGTGVCANLVNPGPVRTAMRAQAMPGEDPDTLARPEDLAPFMVDMVVPDFTENGALYDFPTRKLSTG